MSRRNVVVPEHGMISSPDCLRDQLLSAKGLQKCGRPRDSTPAKETSPQRKHRLSRAFGTRPASRLQTWDIRFSAALALLRSNQLSQFAHCEVVISQ